MLPITTYISWSLFMIVSAIICAHFDSIKIKENISIERDFKNFRALLGVIVNVLFLILINIAYNRGYIILENYKIYKLWCTCIFNIVLLWTIFDLVLLWTIFDLVLNKLRNKSVFYISNNGIDDQDSLHDTTFQKFGNRGGEIQIIVKITLLIVFGLIMY